MLLMFGVDIVFMPAIIQYPASRLYYSRSWQSHLLNHGRILQRLVLSLLFDRQTIQQPGQFTVREGDGLFGITLTGPVKTAFLKPTLIEPETIGLPVQNLEFILPPVAEHKQAF